MTPRELRDQALELIDEHGWVQGWIGDARHGYSPVGAMQAALYDDFDIDCYLWTIANLAHEICGREHLPRDMSEWVIDTWAAQKGRTLNEVRGLLA